MATQQKNKKFDDAKLKERVGKLTRMLQALPSAGVVITKIPVLADAGGDVQQAYEKLAVHILNAPIGLMEC